ncbi:MAG: hypothetical protein EON55_29395 [Alphaproteobacteria bacterium]|nr:MAG: hypothetical protein EON55_29395 [Alphaproteobacteria bacterium]
MRACILVASAQKKDTSSTSGMQSTTATSTLFPRRIAEVVPERMAAMTTAILARDFASFAKLTMRDSNSFHAVCLDTYPPIFYMNDISRAAVRLVERVNAAAGRTVCAYTYDAGPNTVIYYLEADTSAVLPAVRAALSKGTEGYNGLPSTTTKVEIPENLREVLSHGIQRVILTKVGDGPQATQESVLDARGFP